MTWFVFGVIFGLFFLIHSMPLRPAIKSRITAKVGTKVFSIGYWVLTTGMLSLLIWSASEAPYVELWPQMPWQRHILHFNMLIVFQILAFSIARPNPFSFGGAWENTFDPEFPGIVRLFRHPMLVALAIWAGSHLLPNGDLAHFLLFSILTGFAIAGRSLINRRKRREMAPNQWTDLNNAVLQAPLLPAPRSLTNAILRFLAGIAAFVTFSLLHPFVVGVSAI